MYVHACAGMRMHVHISICMCMYGPSICMYCTGMYIAPLLYGDHHPAPKTPSYNLDTGGPHSGHTGTSANRRDPGIHGLNAIFPPCLPTAARLAFDKAKLRTAGRSVVLTFKAKLEIRRNCGPLCAAQPKRHRKKGIQRAAQSHRLC